MTYIKLASGEKKKVLGILKSLEPKISLLSCHMISAACSVTEDEVFLCL